MHHSISKRFLVSLSDENHPNGKLPEPNLRGNWSNILGIWPNGAQNTSYLNEIRRSIPVTEVTEVTLDAKFQVVGVPVK